MQNGTGRDGYIYNNHGGFMQSGSGINPSNTFFTGLRHYEPQSMSRSPSTSSLNKSNSFNTRPDFFTDGQFIVPKKKDQVMLQHLG